MARRKSAAEQAAEAEQESRTAEAEHDEWSRQAQENDDADDAEDGHEAGNAPDDDPDSDLAAMSNVDHDSGGVEVFSQEDKAAGGDNTEGIALGAALTNRQTAGLDPADVNTHLAQASNRRQQTNLQTDFEAENALDGVSGTPNPGITSDVSHTAPGIAGRTDMSGRPPMADPLAGAGAEVRRVSDLLTQASRRAKAEDKRGHGYLSLRELGVNKAVMDALVASGKVTQETRPGGGFNPDTGTVYRLASHKD
jgi:hypothetical protein